MTGFHGHTIVGLYRCWDHGAPITRAMHVVELFRFTCRVIHVGRFVFIFGSRQTYRSISIRPSEIATNLQSAIIWACVFTADKTGKWCPREDSNLRPQDSYHFGFNRRPVANGQDVRGLDCPFTMGLAAFRCCPSSLYTFTGFLRSLARDWHAGRPAKLSPTLSRSIASFPGATPNLS